MTAPKQRLGLQSAAVTVATFAAVCELSPSTVRNMIDRGEINAVRIGRNVRIPVAEFQRFGLDYPVFQSGGGIKCA